MSNYKLVPVEPTPEMLDAAIQDGVIVDGKPVWKKDVAFQAKWKYQQMLASAPTMQVEPVGWVNGDELDNMLDDRTATLFPVRTGFHGKPVYAASQPAEQQPVEGEEIMVNTPYDVFILPLQPSGLGGKGPRFVAHVPGPEQPAAVDALVEALEAVVGYDESVEDRDTNLRMRYADMIKKARSALAAYRKQGVSNGNA